MSLESAIAFFIAIFIFCITPGPGIFAILAKAMAHGVKPCVGLILGMVISDLSYLTFACIGLVAIAENFSGVFLVIRYLGAAYLIYLGYKMFTAVTRLQKLPEADGTATKNTFGFDGLIQGFLISVSNPKVVLFYIAFLPTFIDITQLTAADIVLVNILASLGLMAGGFLVAFAASKVAGLLTTERAVRNLNWSAGGIMVVAGLLLAFSSHSAVA